MKFCATALEGAYLIEPEPTEDERGFFARSYCREEFLAHGIAVDFPQCNISFNKTAGILRGMHYQSAPHEEAKLVRCTRGAIYDVIVDIRPGSPSRGQWIAAELTADNHHMLFIPAGFAHGFQTLSGESEVFYQMSVSYVPGAARGLRWNDPSLAIRWPLPDPLVSPRDAAHPDFA